MRKKTLTLLAWLLFSSASLFAAGPLYSTGMDMFYDSPMESFDIGVYTNALWTAPVGQSGNGLGIGGRADVTLAIPAAEFSTSFMFGLAIESPVGKTAVFTLVAGPSIAVFSDTDSTLCVGGGIDAALTFFADPKQSVGFTVGMNGNFYGTVMPKGDPRFCFYGGGYFGVAMRFDGKNMPYAYHPYNIYIY